MKIDKETMKALTRLGYEPEEITPEVIAVTSIMMGWAKQKKEAKRS